MNAGGRAPLIEPNGVLGVLGGGQLGRMLALAAARLGIRTHIFSPEADVPGHDVCALRTVADYDDRTALEAFARSVDAVTYEFENVPAGTVEILGELGADVSPGAEALAIAQDRLNEKEFLRRIGAATAPYAPVEDIASLEAALGAIGRPAILKTRRFGYDGKGQTRIDARSGDLAETWEEATRRAWDAIGARPAILEGHIDFDCEISIIGARDRQGNVALYDPAKNTHRGGILRRSEAPANASADAERKAQRLTAAILQALNYVGVIGVEFFVTRDGGLIANEFAPRVHNSGHWTLDACSVSQFEQHVRAVAGWPLGEPSRHSDAVMENLIGEDAGDWLRCARERGLCLHLYGKNEMLPGRKMGHATELKPLTPR